MRRNRVCQEKISRCARKNTIDEVESKSFSVMATTIIGPDGRYDTLSATTSELLDTNLESKNTPSQVHTDEIFGAPRNSHYHVSVVSTRRPPIAEIVNHNPGGEREKQLCSRLA
jgi:hypothetical protein